MVFELFYLIYTIKEKHIMKKEKTKMTLTVSMDRKLFEIIENKFNNKSKYIEWLVYQDLLKKSDDEDLKNILI